jgi:hypothetical protein
MNLSDRITAANLAIAHWQHMACCALTDKARAKGLAKTAQAKERLEQVLLQQTREAKHAARVAGLVRYADSVMKRAPAVMLQWQEDREHEHERIRKRKKELRRRVTVDLRAPTPKSRARIAPPPMIFVPVPPPSDPEQALLPGQVEPVRAKRIVGDLIASWNKPELPRTWTTDHVSKRLREAHHVLRRIPMLIWPQMFGRVWPPYKVEAGELVHQVDSGTLEIGRNRAMIGATSDEMARMMEALCWSMTYLFDEPELARATNEFAMDDITGCQQGLRIIAVGLNTDRVLIR